MRMKEPKAKASLSFTYSHTIYNLQTDNRRVMNGYSVGSVIDVWQAWSARLVILAAGVIKATDF